MITFVVALEKEAKTFIEEIKNPHYTEIAGKKVLLGEFCGKDISVIFTNIGKVSASLGVQKAIDEFSPELIVNFGSCGGCGKDIKVGEFYFVSESAQYDLDLRYIDNVPLGYNQGYDKVFFPSLENKTELKSKKLASADKFTYSEKDIQEITDMGCSLYDMEGGAIAQVCFSNNIPYLSIKGISDVFGSGQSGEQYYANVTKICNEFPKVLEKILTIYTK